jgi:glyceraldehyde 3-phosphate dehydrogenase
VCPTRIGINGFGRIGRQVFKILWDRYPALEIAALGVTDAGKTEVRALLLQYDSTYGRFSHTVEARNGKSAPALVVDGRRVPIIPQLEPYRVAQWADFGVDVVIDATGRCKQQFNAEAHLRGGAQKVIITCPVSYADATVVYGVNHHSYVPWQHHILSASSCTTTSLAPVIKVLDDAFGLTEGFVTTIHAYTNSQSLLDTTQRDPRRARAAGSNIIPTTTRAAKALDQVLPGLGSRIEAAALRVPVPSVSMLDLILRLERSATVEQVNEALRQAARGPLQGILAVSDEPLVSTDYLGNSHSAVVDALSTSAVGQLIRVAAWYDNEWGYSCRVADLASYIARQELQVFAMGQVAPSAADAGLATILTD